ncbi:MAG: phenylalanine--tRNA ligase subunit alpha [Candidatus Micrarchaeia archaeon]
MHKHLIKLLKILQERKSLAVDELVKESDLNKDSVLWALSQLQEMGFVRLIKSINTDVVFSEEGESYAKSQLPEEELLARIANEKVKISELKPAEKIGFQWLKASGFVEIKDGYIVAKKTGSIKEGEVLRSLYKDPLNITKIQKESNESIKNLVKRGLITLKISEVVAKAEITEFGEKENPEFGEEIDELNRGIIVNKSWEGKKFKKYDINLDIADAEIAKRHPLRSFLDELREAYVAMGFNEITGPIIEPSFWVFDSLFVPQDHPAREMQDTFYLLNPGKIKLNDKKLIKNVKKVHEKAWHINWYKEVAEQAILRTHTTSISARFIYNLDKDILRGISPSKPLQLFSLGRVFRNESIDYKHLAEFYQTDGIIMGVNLTLANLFDVLKKIYNSIGIEIKFKPSYFPFVEPGVEVDILYNGEWLELGGAGMIRKEITGIVSKKINVLAWGLGVERAFMAKNNNVKSITEFYNSDLGWLRKSVVSWRS